MRCRYEETIGRSHADGQKQVLADYERTAQVMHNVKRSVVRSFVQLFDLTVKDELHHERTSFGSYTAAKDRVNLSRARAANAE